MSNSIINFRLFSVIAISGLLLACNSGSDTVSNPNTGGDTTDYTGPAAATDDVRGYQINVWDNLRAENRCGQCHGVGQEPTFVDSTDVNLAYAEAVPLINFQDPATSLLVTKVGGGHNCWLTSEVACADSLEQMIVNWAGAADDNTARQIQLTAPEIKDPGDSKTFPDFATDNGSDSFSQTVHPLLVAHCQACHEETALLPISPFFGNSDPQTAYDAAKSKINIDNPGGSRFVVRLSEEFHNCWTTSCDDDAQEMTDAIDQFAQAIEPIEIDEDLITSKALNLGDGIVAAGGNRHESNLIALWEFKTGIGGTAFDTSGIEPAINLTLSGSYEWLGGYGVNLTGGKAQGDTIPSKKLHDFIRSAGEYSIEAWVIPANVTQEDANIFSYSAGANSRNFTLGQTLYNYNYYNRSSLSNANGEEILSTEDAGEILQSSLQHVVATYDPINGRSIYVNGELINVTDPVTGSTEISDWDDTFAVVLGNEVSNNRTWNGQIRMAAIHNRILTPEQVLQNFEVGVGEKFFLLFSIAEESGIDDAYIMFEVSQFDSYSYLFNLPTFVSLDPDWTPVSLDIESMRIGINGREALTGQSFANLNVSVDPSTYDPATGQLLSPLGAVIALEKPDNADEFFLTFERLGSESNPFVEASYSVPAAGADAEAVSDIGIKTFEEINASISAMTGVSVNNPAIKDLYDNYRQQLPTVENIDAFLASHQMAIAQIALTSCSELVEADQLLGSGNPSRYFAGFDFTSSAQTAFDSAAKRNQIIDPVLTAAINFTGVASADNLTSQPDEDEIRNMLSSTSSQDLDTGLTGDSYDSLITQMTACGVGCDTTQRTEQIVKAVCAAAVGGAVMLIQ